MRENNWDPLYDDLGRGYANPAGYYVFPDRGGDRIERAVQAVLSAGLRTGDIWSEGLHKVGTREMGDAVVAAITGKTITTKT